MDLVAAGNWVENILVGSSGFVAAHAPWLALLALLIALALSGFGRRVRKVVEKMFFTNWQLTLLGSAALVLSLAGGWTTWDGMRNFTGEPVLSLMFTFGIHGVMLIVAWLIGESFATGMSSVPQRGYARVTAPLIAITAVAGLLLLVALAAYHFRYGIPADQVIHVTAAAGAVMLVIALLAVFSGSDVVAPYTQALRIIARNGMLWVMFLACMSTSVFFSFDSRFNVVFPQEERKRVADLRAQNQVIGILADIEATMTNRRLDQSRQLFESDGWRAYEPHLINLASASQNSQRDIERYFVQQMEDRRRGVAEQQERITTAQTGQIGLASKKLSITDELTRLKGERPGLAGEYSQHKSELEAKRREMDAKRVEALAEDRGVEGSGKAGKGQVYRQRMGELRFLEDEYEIKEQRTKDAQKRLNAAETRIAQIERELTGIDGEIAKMKGEAQTAEQRINAVQEGGAAVDGPKVDPARALLAFETARSEFRQDPTVEHLTQVQQLCGQLHGAMSSTPATKDKVRSIDCDPKQASEAASALFALNCRLQDIPGQLRRGRQTGGIHAGGRVIRFRAQVPGRQRPSEQGYGCPAHQDQLHRADAGRSRPPLRRVMERLQRRQPPRLSGAGDRHRHQFADLHDRLVWRQRRALAPIRCSEQQAPQRAAARGGDRDCAPARHLRERQCGDRCPGADHALRRFHGRGRAAARGEPRQAPHHEGSQRRRDAWRRGARSWPAGSLPGAWRAVRISIRRWPRRRSRPTSGTSIWRSWSGSSQSRYCRASAKMRRRSWVTCIPSATSRGSPARSVSARWRRSTSARSAAHSTQAQHWRACSVRVRTRNHYFIHGDFYKTLARIRGRLLISAAPAYQVGGTLDERRQSIGVASAHPAISYAPERAGNGYADPIDFDGLVTARLLKSIGVEQADYDLLLEPDIHDPAINAGKALDQLRDTRLGRELRQLERRLHVALEAEHKAIEASLQDDVQRHVLVNVNPRIYSLLPALMLSRRGPSIGCCET